MNKNFFRPGVNDDGAHDLHDEAFQMMDVNSNNPTKGWPKGMDNDRKESENLNMEDEMNLTMQQFGERLDNVCSYDPDEGETRTENQFDPDNSGVRVVEIDIVEFVTDTVDENL